MRAQITYTQALAPDANDVAAALTWLVRKYPDTLERLESLAAST